MSEIKHVYAVLKHDYWQFIDNKKIDARLLSVHKTREAALLAAQKELNSIVESRDYQGYVCVIKKRLKE